MRILLTLFVIFFLLCAPAIAKEENVALTQEQLFALASPDQPSDPAGSAMESLTDTQPPHEYHLQNWEVTEEDKVANALAVFKSKASPIPSKRLWIINKNGDQKYFIEYTPNATNKTIIFSPDEDFAFFVGLSDLGESVVYGINFSTGNQYPIDTANHFEMMTCPNSQKNYIIVDKGDTRATYMVYDLSGKPVSSLLDPVTPANIQEKICY